MRQSDTVARLGGDEFALLLEDVHPPEVSSACDRILAALCRGAHVAGHQLALSASIGVAFGDSSETAESMLRNADLAMYEAKAAARTSGSSTNVPSVARGSSASSSSSRSGRPWRPATSPWSTSRSSRASTGYITGVEALARWKSNGVDVPPDVFIRVAEESGLVVALGDVVLEQAARDAAVICQAAGGDFNVSVNISAKQLREPDFVSKVERALAKMGGAPLVLEITERDGIGNDPASMSAMTTLADRGVPFAIDDFGVGFSSIGYLQDMPVQIIKTDLSFSESIDRDERSCALLCSITMMGQALGLDVVVEGIERASQLDHLRDHVHAPFAQGYLMHRPMPLGPAGQGASRRTAPCRRCRSGAERPPQHPARRPRPRRLGSAVGERHLLQLLEGVLALLGQPFIREIDSMVQDWPWKASSGATTVSRYGADVVSVMVPTGIQARKARRSTKKPSRCTICGTPRPMVFSASMSPSIFARPTRHRGTPAPCHPRGAGGASQVWASVRRALIS